MQPIMNWEDLEALGWERLKNPRTGRIEYKRPLQEGKQTKVFRNRDLKPEESHLQGILFPKSIKVTFIFSVNKTLVIAVNS